MRVGFGSYVFDSETRLLARHGSRVHLTPKAFHLLELLLQNRPAAVSKRQILDLLWPESFVSEGCVTNLVSEIRHALADDGLPYLRTVHRFGYAFSGTASDISIPTDKPRRAPCVLIETGPDPRSLGLFEGETSIGRGWDSDVRVSSSTVSRNHARIRVAKRVATIEDLGSRNGTFVSGKRVTGTVRLKDRDRVRVGHVELIFQMEPETDDLGPKKKD